jgi:hypothetical protein
VRGSIADLNAVEAMREIILMIVVAATTSASYARDADSIVFGSQVDALIEYADDLQETSDGDDAATGKRQPAVDPLADVNAAEERIDVIGGRTDSEADEDEANGSSFTLRHGYDDNYDESTEPEASSFTEVVGTASYEGGGDGTQSFVQLGASAIRLHDLEWKERGDAYLDLGLRRELGDGLALQAGLGLSVDATSDPIEGAARATVGLEGTAGDAVWGLKANLSAERALKARVPDEDVPARTYDFQRPEVEASALFSPDSAVSPFVSASLSRSSFPLDLPEGLTDDDDEPIASPLRDATQVSFHAGLRLRPVDDLSVRIGIRGNLRQFDQDGIENLATLGPELSAEWEVSPILSLAAAFDRSIGEPEELGALAEDVTTASGTITVQANEALELSAKGTFERTEVYGIKSEGDQTTFELAAAYAFNARTALQVSYYHLWYKDRVGSDDYTRSRISGGLSLTF